MTWGAVGASVAGAVVGGVMNRGSGGDQRYTSSGNQQTSQSQQSSAAYNPNAALMPAYNNILGQMNYLSGQPMPFFPGQTYVGPSAGTMAGVEAGMGAMPYYQQGAALYGAGSPMYQQGAALYGAGSPMYQQGSQQALEAIGSQQGINNMSMGNYGFLSNAADVANNPYVQGQLGRNRQEVTQALNEQWMPQINSGAQAVNALGSSRHGVAQAQGVERAAQQLANANASTMNTAYGQGLGAQQHALSMTPQMLQNQLAPAMTSAYAGSLMGQAGNMQGMAGGLMGQAGNMQGMAGDLMNKAGQTGLGYGQTVEGYQKAALDDAMARWAHQYEEPWQRMQNTASMLGMSPFYSIGVQQGAGGGMSNSTGMMPNPGYMSPYQAMAGRAQLGYGLYNQYRQGQK